LELSASPGKPKVYTLTGPHRLVIDLPSTAAARGMKLPRPAGPVSAVRDGVQPGGVLRIVLELKQAIDWNSSVQGRQLVVDLGRVSAAASTASTAAAAAPTAAAKVPVRANHAP